MRKLTTAGEEWMVWAWGLHQEFGLQNFSCFRDTANSQLTAKATCHSCIAFLWLLAAVTLAHWIVPPKFISAKYAFPRPARSYQNINAVMLSHSADRISWKQQGLMAFSPVFAYMQLIYTFLESSFPPVNPPLHMPVFFNCLTDQDVKLEGWFWNRGQPALLTSFWIILSSLLV